MLGAAGAAARRLALPGRSLSTSVPCTLVDVFGARVGTGNPAGVVRLARMDQASAQTMQTLAAEINASATAFVAPVGGAADTYDVRWFSSSAEVPICGHATLGTAKALLQEEGAAADSGRRRLVLRSPAGDLSVRPTDDGQTLELSLESSAPTRLDVPDAARASERFPTHPGLCAALGVAPRDVRYLGRNKYDLLIELVDPAAVEALVPDQALLSGIEARGFIVTAEGGCPRCPEAAFTSRFFGPSMGIPEDPATGSAQCGLAPYWAKRLGVVQEASQGGEGMLGFQASARGGQMRLWIAADAATGEERVLVRSEAVVVIEGMIMLP